LRGIARCTASMTGLLLLYGIVYALEGMTTRISSNRWYELASTTLWILPLTLLFFPGLDDFSRVTRKEWTVWVGTILALSLLYYFERNTSSALLTKTMMPMLAVAGGLVPHIVKRLRFVFAVCGVAAGVAGIFVFYSVITTLLSPRSSFATKGVEFVLIAFGASALAAGILTLIPPRTANLAGSR